MASSITVGLTADERDLTRGMAAAERAVADAAASIDRQTDKIDAAFESVAGGADTVASKGSQAAGALGGLGGLAESAGGPFAALGGAMTGASVAAQGLADAGDLVNFVTELGIGKQTLLKVQTIATTAAQKAAAAASKAWAVAQGLLNAVMSANPIGLVVAAVALLVAGFVLAYKKSDKFREIVDKAFSVIKRVASDVANFFTTKVPAAFGKIQAAASTVLGFIKSKWPLLLAILTGPFGLAVLAVVKNFDKIKDGAKAAIEFVKEKFGDMVQFIKDLPGKIKDVFTGLFGGLAQSLEDAINNVLGLPLKIPVIDTHIPGIGKVGGQTLIPALAKGGIVTGPTLALIGEAGPEAVIPLNGKYGVGGGDITVHVHAPVGSSPTEIGKTLQKFLDAYKGSGGRQVAF